MHKLDFVHEGFSSSFLAVDETLTESFHGQFLLGKPVLYKVNLSKRTLTDLLKSVISIMEISLDCVETEVLDPGVPGLSLFSDNLGQLLISNERYLVNTILLLELCSNPLEVNVTSDFGVLRVLGVEHSLLS